jgi:hypothetical protein
MLVPDIPRWADLTTEQHKPNERYQKSERQLYLHAGSLVAMHCGARRLSKLKMNHTCGMDEAFRDSLGPEYKSINIELSC